VMNSSCMPEIAINYRPAPDAGTTGC